MQVDPPRPRVMGILNVTPDSFSDGGAFDDPTRAGARARQIVSQGADLLDIGGESTRPGSDPISLDMELARVLPVLDRLGPDSPLPLSIPISIDTRRAAVADAAAARGATILNDTAALRDDPEIAAVAAERGMTVVLMHRRGIPRTMQQSVSYDDLLTEVRAFFEDRVEAAIEAGIPRERIVLDPGIGFGKSALDNERLLAHLDRIRLPGIPLLVGASRKSFLARHGGQLAADRLPGSLAVAAVCARQSVEFLRVHDVAETVAFLRSLAAIEGSVIEGASEVAHS